MFADFIGWDLGKQIARTAFERSTVSGFFAQKMCTVEKWESPDKGNDFQDAIFSHLLGWVNPSLAN